MAREPHAQCRLERQNYSTSLHGASCIILGLHGNDCLLDSTGLSLSTQPVSSQGAGFILLTPWRCSRPLHVLGILCCL